MLVEPAAESRPVDGRDPAGAVREIEAGAEEVVAVACDLREDLAEAESDDREVVAAQAERRQADQHADDGRRDPCHRQDEPDREMKAGRAGVEPDRPEVQVLLRELRRGEPTGHVRAHRIEGDVTEVEQPGVPDDEVQAERHHGEDRHHDERRELGERAEERHLGHRVDVVGIAGHDRNHRGGCKPLPDAPAADRHPVPGRCEQQEDDRPDRERGRLPDAEGRNENEEGRDPEAGLDGASPGQRQCVPALARQADGAEARPPGARDRLNDAAPHVRPLRAFAPRAALRAGRRGSGSGSRRRSTGSSRCPASATGGRRCTPG